MTTKEKLIDVLCFIIAIIAIMFKLDIVGIQTTENPVRTFIFNVAHVEIPKEEDLRSLEDDFEDLLDYLEKNDVVKDEIAMSYIKVKEATVCSIANRNFNTLEEQYTEYMEKMTKLIDYTREIEERYQEYKKLVDEIPKFSRALRQQKCQEFETVIEPLYTKVCKEEARYLLDKRKVQFMYQDAKEIADDFFDEYYELMCHIVNAEAGTQRCTTMERCYVANVIENRIKSSRFPNTINGVVYAQGQYEPVMIGTIHNEPYPWVREEMEEYLRGRVETGMPDNVVYQSLFRQGSGTWKHMSSGHYFCYY